MMQSLRIKLGMLNMAMGVVFWIGWKAPQASVEPALSAASSEVAPVPSPVTLESETNIHSQYSDGPASARTRVLENAVRVTGRRIADCWTSILPLQKILNHCRAVDTFSTSG